MSEDAKESDPGVVLRGFLGAYAPGNGPYKFIGPTADGNPSYARDSDIAATNWRIYYAAGHWVVGNEEGLKAVSLGSFATVTSNAKHPADVTKIWSNSRVNIIKRGYGPLIADVTVSGFTGGYAPGNGKYNYIGDSNEAPAYARQSDTHATNWRVYRIWDTHWLISNSDGLASGSSGNFSYAVSSEDRPPIDGWNNKAVHMGVPEIYVRGFLDAYAPGNGTYSYIGQKNERPAYKRASDTEATNWRVYYTAGNWVIGNSDGYEKDSTGGFAIAESEADSPPSVTCLWSNNKVNVLEHGDPPLVPDIVVGGFEGAYAPGNGTYYYCGDTTGRPAYARDSLSKATNWRIWYSSGLWIIGNSDGLSADSTGGFASVATEDNRPPEKGWNNEKVTVKESDGTVVPVPVD